MKSFEFCKINNLLPVGGVVRVSGVVIGVARGELGGADGVVF